MTAGFRWTENGSEKTHELGYPFKLESAPALERSRYSATPVDKSAAPTVLEVGSAVEIATARIRFDRFPRRLLRLLDRGASMTEIDYYPDLARDTFFPLLMRDMGNLQAIDPDADRFGGGEYERRLEVRSRDGTPIWPLYGTVEFNGTGEENLIRDALMDTDSDGDGVVDRFDLNRQETGWTVSLNGSEGAQEATADGSGTTSDFLDIFHRAVRVFPGDVVTLSVETKVANATNIEGEIEIVAHDENNGFIVTSARDTYSNTTYQRRVITATGLPDETAIVRLTFRGRLSANGGSGDVRWRKARLLRGSGDPATYANPHVSGASQSGDTLDTSGWPASQQNIIRAGDIIQVGGSGGVLVDDLTPFLRATADVDADANGDATIPLEFDIGADDAPADGAALRLVHPMFDS